jgi:hypothetical protein
MLTSELCSVSRGHTSHTDALDLCSNGVDWEIQRDL